MPPATASASAARAREQLLDLLGPPVHDAGYDLEDIAVSSAGRRSLVRVTVDADGGIDLDAVAVVSRLVSDLLDAEGDHLLRGAYVLEVSSPGVDRPLTEPRHWRRATGRLVTVEVAGKPLTGRVQRVEDTAVTFDVDGKARTVPLADLGRGRVQVEFSHAADHGDEPPAEQEEG
jgi:ribosome maturation factor RimP